MLNGDYRKECKQKQSTMYKKSKYVILIEMEAVIFATTLISHLCSYTSVKNIHFFERTKQSLDLPKNTLTNVWTTLSLARMAKG